MHTLAHMSPTAQLFARLLPKGKSEHLLKFCESKRCVHSSTRQNRFLRLLPGLHRHKPMKRAEKTWNEERSACTLACSSAGSGVSALCQPASFSRQKLEDCTHTYHPQGLIASILACLHLQSQGAAPSLCPNPDCPSAYLERAKGKRRVCVPNFNGERSCCQVSDELPSMWVCLLLPEAISKHIWAHHTPRMTVHSHLHVHSSMYILCTYRSIDAKCDRHSVGATVRSQYTRFLLSDTCLALQHCSFCLRQA